MITLYTSYYQHGNAIRQAELDYCFAKNVENPYIEKIVCFLEGSDKPTDHHKIEYLNEGRPTYKMFFSQINRRAGQLDISIIGNSDIYYDETIKQATLMNGKMAICLSRWDVEIGKEPKLHNCSGSQDSWIFMGKVTPVRYCEFYLGVPGCDNRIAWELSRAGYNLVNPASIIKSYHYHPSDLHTYIGDNGQIKDYLYIAKPYLFVELT